MGNLPLPDGSPTPQPPCRLLHLPRLRLDLRLRLASAVAPAVNLHRIAPLSDDFILLAPRRLPTRRSVHHPRSPSLS